MLVLQILCRYKLHACRSAYTCTDKFPNVPTKLWKSTPPPSLPTGYANGWQCQGSRYNIMIWGICARSARKFKELVCLVVLLCWIKRFVLLSLCLNANIWIDIFHAFKNRGGTIPPRKNSRGGHVPPVPPGIAAYALNSFPLCVYALRQGSLSTIGQLSLSTQV